MAGAKAKKRVGIFYLNVDATQKNDAELRFEVPDEFSLTARGSNLTQIVENLVTVSNELRDGIISERKCFEWQYL